MDPLWSEICWSTFKYFVILIVSTYYILCISWIKKCLSIQVFLTLILLTWRIWWAPNNASRWQMGFNSALKVLKETAGCFCLSTTRTVWGQLQLACRSRYTSLSRCVKKLKPETRRSSEVKRLTSNCKNIVHNRKFRELKKWFPPKGANK